jgi:hypothetical protein
MVEEEITTYKQWLEQPKEIALSFSSIFEIERRSIGFGKIAMVCRKRGAK